MMINYFNDVHIVFIYTCTFNSEFNGHEMSVKHQCNDKTDSPICVTCAFYFRLHFLDFNTFACLTKRVEKPFL